MKPLPSILGRLLIMALVSSCPARQNRDITLDQINSSGDEAAARAAASVVSGASHPLSLTGDALLKIQAHRFTQCPAWLETDRSWIEPSDGKLLLRMRVRPGRHAIMWTGMGFSFGRIAGTGLPNPLSPSVNNAVTLDSVPFIENMTMDKTASGMALLFDDATLWLRLGGIIWVQSSPLSVWGGEREIRSAETKRYAWDYQSWEDEKPIAQFYIDRTIKGESIGEAADRWNKQPFKGVNLESEGLLPGNIYTNLYFGQRDAADKNYGRNPVDFGNHYVFHGRISRSEPNRSAGKLVLGLNYLSMFYGQDVTRYESYESWNEKFLSYWGLTGQGLPRGEAYFRNHQTVSIDFGGLLTPKTEMLVEAAGGFSDSVQVRFDSLGEHRTSHHGFDAFALYGQVRDDHLIPLRLELAYLPENYYSYQGYDRNRIGANLSYLPKTANGKLRISYGHQTELAPSPDFLKLPFRLNGPDFQTMLFGTYSRYAGARMDKLYPAKYQARMGDESARARPEPFDDALTGGIRGDFQTTWETFVAFDSLAQARNTHWDEAVDTMSELGKKQYISRHIPWSRKQSFLIDCDFSCDISALLRSSRKMLLVGGLMLDGTSSNVQPVAFSQKDMLLWGAYARLEPAVAITPDFFFTLLYGFEWWKTDKTYTIVNRNQYLHAPIDYRDQALGIGFDWDITRRVGLHGRYKVSHHDDVNWKDNTYLNHFGYGLVKTWF